MSTTLAAVFDSYSDANQASNELQAAGIDKQFIQLNGASSMQSDTTTTSQSKGDDEPGAISRFFSSMFGMNDDTSNATKYSEAAKRGQAVLTVSVTEDDRVDDITDILNECGAIDVDERGQARNASGNLTGSTGIAAVSTGMNTNTGTGNDYGVGKGVADTAGANDTLERVEETMQVGKQVVQNGSVRVNQRVVETPVQEQVLLREERASIERKTVDRPATEADLQPAFKDKNIDIQETAEEAAIAKTAKVVEEIQVAKKATDRAETVRETLRRTEIDVENGAGMTASNNQVYSGFERRMRNDPQYSGEERRMAA